MPSSGVIQRYGKRLRIATSAGIVTLHEGDTPLIPAQRLGKHVAPGARLYLKYEGTNPTGSFKDRGMTAAVTDALASGACAVLCASTGNTAASAAAYAARAGLTCVVVLPEGKVAAGKLAGAAAYGAKIVPVRGTFDAALRLVQEACGQGGFTLVNSLNPARIEGQKTAAFEIVEALGAAPDWLSLPVGNAGNITSYWKGFCEAVAYGDCAGTPRILGVQAEGAAPLVRGRPVEHPETVATAIRIGNPARWRDAEEALCQSRGHILDVSDEEILDAYHRIATAEGVFCEPASAASVAGLAKAVLSGIVDTVDRTIVCVLTGHGLKDPDTAIRGSAAAPAIPAEVDQLLRMLRCDF